MACLLGFVSLIAYIASQFPVSEIVKILIVLFSIPLILFVGVKISRNDSLWTLTETDLIIDMQGDKKIIPVSDIVYFRNLRRSGGNLFMIHIQNQSTYRCWRNKLFQDLDEMDLLVEALKNKEVEYYDM